MPIVRTYACEHCFHVMEVTLTKAQWNAPPPDCPRCNEVNQMRQEFRPIAINGSNSARAHAIAEDIVANDYHVADMDNDGRREGGVPKVRYKEQKSYSPASQWGSTPSSPRR